MVMWCSRFGVLEDVFWACILNFGLCFELGSVLLGHGLYWYFWACVCGTFVRRLDFDYVLSGCGFELLWCEVYRSSDVGFTFGVWVCVGLKISC